MIRPLLSVASNSRNSSLELARQTAMACCCISPSSRSTQPASCPSNSKRSTTTTTVDVRKSALGFQDQTCCGEQSERFPRPLRVPDQATLFSRLGAAIDDAIDCASLVLPKHRLPSLAVLYIKENPVAPACAGNRSARRMTALRTGSCPQYVLSTWPCIVVTNSK